MYENIIAIPYRNRAEHLDYFIKNTVPLLQEYLPNTKVVVVEQSEGKLFNRGAVLNVAFKEYENKTKYFFTHDVDINPTKKCIEELYTKDMTNTEVLGIFTSICNTLGGIIKIRDNVIQLINGFPNDVWGWGTEDKALQNRAEYYNIKKIANLTSNKKYPDYLLRFNDVDDRENKYTSQNTNKHYHNFQRLNKEQKKQEIMSSGLNNVKYTILERKMIHDMVELIKVEI
tara:strand:- start:887 stop:1573 length:687 start_codon:yes stop_codon:yes gene_type:complete